MSSHMVVSSAIHIVQKLLVLFTQLIPRDGYTYFLKEAKLKWRRDKYLFMNYVYVGSSNIDGLVLTYIGPY